MTGGDNLVDDIINQLEWPKNWTKDARGDFVVWIKNSLINTPNYHHKKKLNELVDTLIKLEEKTKKVID